MRRMHGTNSSRGHAQGALLDSGCPGQGRRDEWVAGGGQRGSVCAGSVRASSSGGVGWTPRLARRGTAHMGSAKRTAPIAATAASPTSHSSAQSAERALCSALCTGEAGGGQARARRCGRAGRCTCLIGRCRGWADARSSELLRLGWGCGRARAGLAGGPFCPACSTCFATWPRL